MSKIDINRVIDDSKFNKFFLLVVAISVLITISDGYDIVVYGTTLPLIMKDFNLSPTVAGLIGSMALIGMIVGAIVFGMLSDRIGRKKAIILGIVFYSLFNGFIGFTKSANVFALLRFLSGMGMGAAIALTTAVVSEYSPKRNRNLLVTLNNLGTGVGQTACTVIGVAVLGYFSWKMMYWLVLIQLAVPFIVHLFYPESPVFYLKNKEYNKIETILRKADPNFMPGEQDEYEVSAFNRTKATIGNLFRGGFARNTILIWVIFFCNMYLMFGINVWLPKLMTIMGYTLKSGLEFTVVYFLGSLVGVPVSGVLADRIGLKRTMVIVYVGSALLINVMTIKVHPALYMVLLFITGAFLNPPNVLTLTFTAQNYPTAIRGTGLGWGTGIGRLGSVMAPTVVGILISANLSPTMTLATFTIPALLGVLSVLCTRKMSELEASTTSVP